MTAFEILAQKPRLPVGHLACCRFPDWKLAAGQVTEPHDSSHAPGTDLNGDTLFVVDGPRGTNHLQPGHRPRWDAR